MNTGWIKIYRSLLYWEWADVPEMVALWCGGSRENVGRCCRDNASRKVCKHSWRPGQKKGSTTINTDHRYMGIRFYFEADREIWMPKFKKQ